MNTRSSGNERPEAGRRGLPRHKSWLCGALFMPGNGAVRQVGGKN